MLFAMLLPGTERSKGLSGPDRTTRLPGTNWSDWGYGSSRGYWPDGSHRADRSYRNSGSHRGYWSNGSHRPNRSNRGNGTDGRSGSAGRAWRSGTKRRSRTRRS